MKYPAYPKYKDSGVEWLGEVPEHWDVKRLKMSVHLADKKVEADEENPVPYVGLENIESWTGKLLPINPDIVPSGIANSFSPGSTLFGKLRPYLAKVCVPNFKGLCSTELLVIEGVDFDKKALLYMLLSDGFIKLVDSSTYGAKMPRANWDFIGNCSLPVPNKDEQTTIVDFLDQATGKIDTLVAKKRALIELLKEKRTALISRTVTRGLPLEVAREFGLEPHTSFKDSGIEWLGEVPEGWEVWKMSHICSKILDGTHFSPSSDAFGEYKYITAKNIKETGLDLSNLTYVSSEDHRLIYTRCPVKKEDVLYIKDGATAGIATVNTLDEEFSMLSSVALLRPVAGLLESRYFAYQLNSIHFKKYVLNGLVGGAMTRFTLEIINRFRLVLPPLHEQAAIATYLDRETTKIDSLIEKIVAAIIRLLEYRTALITAAVTGKIDIRETAA